METLELIKNRRSVKSYKNDPVPKELLEKIAEAGTFAPNGKGAQAAKIVVITNKEIRDRLSKLNASIMGKEEGFDPFYGAPVVFWVLADKDCFTSVYDGSVVLENLQLAATDLGLGACWIHRAKQEVESEEGQAILKEIGIEGNYEGVGHCVVGYIDGDLPAAKPRKDDYVVWAE